MSSGQVGRRNHLHQVKDHSHQSVLSERENQLKDAVVGREECLAFLGILQKSVWRGEDVFGNHIGGETPRQNRQIQRSLCSSSFVKPVAHLVDRGCHD